MRLAVVLKSVLTVSLVVSVAARGRHRRAEKVSQEGTLEEDNIVECDLYLADSTIPNAGLGVFTAVDKEVGDFVGDGDKCFPLLEYELHNNGREYYFNPFADYVWAGEVMGMKFEVGSGDIEANCPGLDCAINCNNALLNVGKSIPEYDDAGLHRHYQPAAGAMSPYHNGTTQVLRAIPAGGELFKHYGDDWFTSRPDIFKNIPLSFDFPRAQRLLDKFDEIGASDSMKEKLYNALVEIRTIWDARVLNALPTAFEDAKLAISVDIHEAYQANSTRSIDWLQKNGKCIDHIRHGLSSLKAYGDEEGNVYASGVGHGAFAKRALPKGTIITGSPLHHVPDRTYFNIYSYEEGNNGHMHRSQQVVGSQLILNYCYGHRETTLVLCPYGSGVNYINHNQTLANVRIQWSKDGMTKQDDSWLALNPLRDMLSDTSAHLAFDYVATRDIEEGEELFLDYGNEWEQAWKNHEQNWQPEYEWSEQYLSAYRWNELMQGVPLRTEVEAFYDPYPLTLQIRCHTSLADSIDWTHTRVFDWSLAEVGYPCRILERHDTNPQSYTVEVTTEPKDRWDPRVEPRVYPRQNVPREAIHFFDLPYTTDMHLRGAFRHYIGIPDDMIPDAWKNIPNGHMTSPKEEL